MTASERTHERHVILVSGYPVWTIDHNKNVYLISGFSNAQQIKSVTIHIDSLWCGRIIELCRVEAGGAGVRAGRTHSRVTIKIY